MSSGGTDHGDGSFPGTQGIFASGKADTGGAPQFDTGMAKGLQAFMKAGQATGEGFNAGRINYSPENGTNGQNAQAGEIVQGQGQEVRGSVDNYEVRGSVDPGNVPTKPSPGAYTQRDLSDMLKGNDYESREYQRQQQERENWEKLKGIDPETQQMIDGPNDPLKNIFITSPYGYRNKPRGKHRGVDIRNPLGANVFASESGVVMNIQPGQTHGENQVVIRNKDGSTSFYSHTTPGVKKGQRVYSGDVVGVTDMTGRTDGPHLHYGIRDAQGNWIDPTTKLPKK